MSRTGHGALRRFDVRVQVVAGLVVAALGLVTFVQAALSARSHAALERSELARARTALDRLADRLAPALSEGAGISPSFLRRHAVACEFRRVRLLDRAGRELVASDAAEVEGPESAKRVPSPGPATAWRVDVPGYGAAIVASLRVERGKVASIEAWRDAHELGALERSIAVSRGIQVAALVSLAVAALVFARWVSRPYRHLAEAAGKAGLSDARESSEPHALAGTFAAVVQKLHDQEQSLGRVDRESGGLGDLVRFASNPARSMATGVVALDRRGHVAAMNEAAAALLGTSADEASGRPLLASAPSVSELARFLERCLGEGRAVSREVVRFDLPDGDVRHVGIAMSPSLGAEGKISGALLLMSDLTEIRELEASTRARETLASVGAVAAGIAHEFRNALGTILANAKLLEKRDDALVVGPARAIVSEVDAAGAVVDEFLAFARPSASRPEVFDLGALLRRCAATAPDGASIEVDGAFGRVRADPGAMRRSIDNLFRNAWEAAAGAVRIRVRGRAVGSRRAIQVEIEDDGPGVPAEVRERVFEPFFTTRERGTGLGLAFVHRTIVDAGGSIEIGEGAAGGALFRVRLPVAESGDGNVEPSVAV